MSMTCDNVIGREISNFSTFVELYILKGHEFYLKFFSLQENVITGLSKMTYWNRARSSDHEE